MIDQILLHPPVQRDVGEPPLQPDEAFAVAGGRHGRPDPRQIVRHGNDVLGADDVDGLGGQLLAGHCPHAFYFYGAAHTTLG